MAQDVQAMNVTPKEVKKKFDDTLARNLERNLSAGLSSEGLSLNLTALSSLVLLVERESEMEMSPEDGPGRFTEDTFLRALEEVGLDSEEDMRREIQQMIEKGYIDVGSDGSLLAQTSAKDMACLLDKAFPGMPGMNLVAYLIQTLDEALSGRKEPEFAILQLDQTLQMHGSLTKKALVSDKASSTKRKEGQSADALKSALSATLRKRQANQKEHISRSDTTHQPKIVTSGGRVTSMQIKEVFTKKEVTLETPPAMDEDMAQDHGGEVFSVSDSDAALSEQGDGVGSDSLQDDMNASLSEDMQSVSDSVNPDETTAASLPPNHGETKEEKAVPGFPAEVAEETDAAGRQLLEEEVVEEEPPQKRASTAEALVEPRSDTQQDTSAISDEALEARIADFEQNLALTCPVCGASKVETKETAKGKIFYVCQQQDCVFVSWGKPYHFDCPWCKNPFLIEATGKAGKPILRCPRATCRYQQGLPGQGDPSMEQTPSKSQGALPSTGVVQRPKKKKRVVRRRVVRRKRK